MLALDPRIFAPVWKVAESLLPPVIDEHPLGCHRPRVGARQCLFGIAARPVTGAAWETVGRLVGVSESTLLRRGDEWQRAGVFTRLAELALSGYDQMIGLRPDEISIEASIHKAPMGGEGTGPSPVDRGSGAGSGRWPPTPTGSRSLGARGRNTPDTQLLEDTLDVLDASDFEVEIEQTHLDRGYDAVAVREAFAEAGIEAHIAHRANMFADASTTSAPQRSPPRATLES